jgi:hypothetical protein
MPKKNPAQSYDSYEVITQEDPETGDMLIPIPPHLLKELGWKEGDDIDFTIDDKGRIVLKKI